LILPFSYLLFLFFPFPSTSQHSSQDITSIILPLNSLLSSQTARMSANDSTAQLLVPKRFHRRCTLEGIQVFTPNPNQSKHLLSKSSVVMVKLGQLMDLLIRIIKIINLTQRPLMPLHRTPINSNNSNCFKRINNNQPNWWNNWNRWELHMRDKKLQTGRYIF